MKSALSILVIEDDKYTRLNLREILSPFGIIEEAQNEAEALLKLKSQLFDVVLTDIDLGDGSGVNLIAMAVKKGAQCIVVSSYEEEEIIEKAYTLGASHFLSKAKLREKLPVYINKFLQEKTESFAEFLRSEFITQDEELIRELKQLCQWNLKNQSLLITGPTGTGKSLLGKLLHRMTSPEAALVHLNCSEIPENLIESELFGHEKGAFTGADSKKQGKLLAADGGTLFLDEVATMPLPMQQKLLKALDEKTFYPVGSSTPVKSNFTLITATCEDMSEKIQKKLFREDLFYRISGYRFHLKSLAERPSDIDLLVKHFQKSSPRRFVIKPEAIELMKRHAWPGNVRELAKTCERFSQSATGIIDEKSLSKLILQEKTLISGNENWDDFILSHGLRALITQLEKKAVEDSLRRNNGKITACIKELKISSSAFYRILQDHELHL